MSSLRATDSPDGSMAVLLEHSPEEPRRWLPLWAGSRLRSLFRRSECRSGVGLGTTASTAGPSVNESCGCNDTPGRRRRLDANHHSDHPPGGRRAACPPGGRRGGGAVNPPRKGPRPGLRLVGRRVFSDSSHRVRLATPAPERPRAPRPRPFRSLARPHPVHHDHGGEHEGDVRPGGGPRRDRLRREAVPDLRAAGEGPGGPGFMAVRSCSKISFPMQGVISCAGGRCSSTPRGSCPS